MADEMPSDAGDVLQIDRLGAQGDGIADTPKGPVYVARTLPGEEVLAKVDEGRGALRKILRASAARVAPPCGLFGRCGGCALQHMATPAYLDWKTESLHRALGSRALEAPIDPVREIGAATRRRAVFAVRRTKKTVQLGFHAARQAAIVDLTQCDCKILHPAILHALPALKDLVAPMLSRRGEAQISVTLAMNGLDVAISGLRLEITPEELRQLAAEAVANGILRLTIAGDMVAAQADPLVEFAGVAVALPPGSFLQASPEADRIMAELTVEALLGARNVLDLFCGVGTLSLPIARNAQVLAIDTDKQAISALAHAVRHAQGLKPVRVRARDLFKEALADKELTGFDAVVFDPPRAGAKAQAKALAASDVPLIVAVSCNPGTLARDLRILVDGGYRIERVTPVDQFLYSPHIEAIAVLRR